jgi:hypothetical protein
MQFPGISIALIKPKNPTQSKTNTKQEISQYYQFTFTKAQSKNKSYIPSPMHQGDEHSVDKETHVLDPRPTILPVKKSCSASAEIYPSTPKETILIERSEY